MNPSTTTDMNSNFSFNSPSIARPGLVFAKSRISKRRGINRPNLKPDSQSGPGVNPFLLGSEYSSVLGSPRPRVDTPVIGESGLRSNDSADNLAQGVLEELRSLKIGINDADSSMNAAKSCLDSKGGNDNSRILGGGSSILEDDLRKLNIQVSENGPSEKNDNVDQNVVRKDSKPGAGTESGLPDELKKKLNINGYAAEKTADLSSSVERSTAIFPDQVKNLNVEGSSCTATTANRDDPNIQRQENASFLLFGGRGNTSDYIGVTESLLSNAIQKKLNIGSESAESYRQNKDGFSFTSKQTDMGASFVEFKTPSSKLNPVSSFNQKEELTAKREKIDRARLKKRGKSRQQPSHGQSQTAKDFVPTESTSHELDASLSYSPMDVSPYPEENRSSRETSMTSNESFSIDQNFSSNDSEQPVSNDEVDQVLVAAAQRMEINSDDETEDVVHNDSAQVFERVVSNEGPSEGYTSMTETESFKSATDEIDLIRDDAVSSADKTATSCSSSLERKDSGGTTQYFSCSQSEETAGSNFTFSAFSAAQGQYSAPKRSNKKKPSSNAGYSPYNVEIPHPSSSILQFTSSATSSLLSPQLERGKRSTSQYKDVKDSKMNVVKDGKLGGTSPTSATMAAQEACEKWRLRGNQAYTSGDISKAEDCYTQGIKCIPRSAMSRSCLRALMLCYSNRAATRISLGRMRDALVDCLMATEIDPNFFKVLLRAANCYLALGEIEEALHYYRKCMQADSEVCVDRKIAVEASEGIQKAQKVSQCMNDSAELLLAKTSKDAENSLEIISEALFISAYSEKLVEMKAEAMFLLQRYQEVIQLCEQTLDLAEKNSISVGVDNQSGNWDASEFSKRFHFRFWRCSLSFKSYFHLGKLEEGLASLEKQAEQLLSANRYGYSILESSIPLVKTVREVINLKNSGNEAFQAGKHAEAVDLYTAALSCNVESRPFAAICFCNRAAAYKALGQITDAIADCSLAIALDGNYWKAISRRASLYEMIRDYGQAAVNLERLVCVLTNHVEKASQGGGGYDRSQSCASELRQARIRLSDIEEEAKKDIPLDMYLIMGVESSASASEIKKAYRKAALRHHPDKALQYLGKGDGGDERQWKEIGEEVYKDADRLFKMIGEAYGVLSDTTKRSRYDVEEELRKKGGGGCKEEERNGSSRHQWREAWKSSSQGRGGFSDSNRWARYT